MIAACRAAGIDAIDGPFGDFKNDRAYMKQATYAATLGAVGKWCIHPNQIPLTNYVFAPSPREIRQAQKMVDLYNESVAKGAGANGKGGGWWMRRRCGSMSRCWSGRGLLGGCRVEVRARPLRNVPFFPPLDSLSGHLGVGGLFPLQPLEIRLVRHEVRRERVTAVMPPLRPAHYVPAGVYKV